jgi:uncharacterized protein YhbP (UPF0306 family)
MDKEIVEFIDANIVANVCCVDGEMPYCFTCYYSFMEQEGLLVYKSSFGTKHEEILRKNKFVAGTIVPEHVEVSVIKGIQYEGILMEDSMELTMKASASYYLKFPFALAVPGKIYAMELRYITYTDNTRGFGYKQHWAKEG